MRITNGMIAANTLRNINKAANRLAAANEAVSSNMKIQLASDDPTVATRAVTYRSYVSQIKQYQDNVDSAQGWQKSTDDALSDLSDDITTLKTLTNQATNDTNSESNLSDIKARIETLKNDIVTLMNTDYSGSYVFGGYSTGESPYEVVTTTIGETVTYKGDYLSLGGVVSSDISDDDIKSFYTANTGNVYDSLSDAAANAQTAYTNAQTAYTNAQTAGSTTTVLAALADKVNVAKTTSDTLAAAVTSYGSTTTLTDAAAEAKTDYTTLTTAVTSYGGTSTLTDAAASALTAYNTAKAAADAAPADTTLATAAEEAKTVSDTLAAVVTSYGSTAASTTTLTAATATALTTANTLAAAVTNSAQNINYNIGFSSEATVNIEGQDVIGEGTGSNLFDTIEKLLLALDGATSYKTASLDSSGNVTVTTNSLDLTDLIDEFTTDLDRVTVAQAKLGANMNTVNNASDRLDSAYEAYKELMTNNENIDTAVAATELTSAEYTYEAALAVGAKVTTKSLIDYIA